MMLIANIKYCRKRLSKYMMSGTWQCEQGTYDVRGVLRPKISTSRRASRYSIRITSRETSVVTKEARGLCALMCTRARSALRDEGSMGHEATSMRNSGNGEGAASCHGTITRDVTRLGTPIGVMGTCGEISPPKKQQDLTGGVSE